MKKRIILLSSIIILCSVYITHAGDMNMNNAIVDFFKFQNNNSSSWHTSTNLWALGNCSDGGNVCEVWGVYGYSYLNDVHGLWGQAHDDSRLRSWYSNGKPQWSYLDRDNNTWDGDCIDGESHPGYWYYYSGRVSGRDTAGERVNGFNYDNETGITSWLLKMRYRYFNSSTRYTTLIKLGTYW